MTSFDADLIPLGAPAADVHDAAPTASAPGQAQPPAASQEERQPVARTTSRRRLRPVARRWRGPSWRWLTVYSLVLIVGLVGVLLAGFWGVRAGLEQRRMAQATAVADHYQRGLAHAAAGRKCAGGG